MFAFQLKIAIPVGKLTEALASKDGQTENRLMLSLTKETVQIIYLLLKLHCQLQPELRCRAKTMCADYVSKSSPRIDTQNQTESKINMMQTREDIYSN